MREFTESILFLSTCFIFLSALISILFLPIWHETKYFSMYQSAQQTQETRLFLGFNSDFSTTLTKRNEEKPRCVADVAAGSHVAVCRGGQPVSDRTDEGWMDSGHHPTTAPHSVIKAPSRKLPEWDEGL